MEDDEVRTVMLADSGVIVGVCFFVRLDHSVMVSTVNLGL